MIFLLDILLAAGEIVLNVWAERRDKRKRRGQVSHGERDGRRPCEAAQGPKVYGSDYRE